MTKLNSIEFDFLPLDNERLLLVCGECDESQNTTSEQMKMFLTRIGFQSKAVITGDITQIDLPGSTRSGLRHVVEVVQRIVEAYESHEADDDRHR